MEIETKIPILSEREAFIKAAYAEKKGRDTDSQSIFTCYVNIDCPTPNLPVLTASMLDELSKNHFEAYSWASKWDKSIISIAPDSKLGCIFLRDDDSKGKIFVPVSTTKIVDTVEMLKTMPEGELAFIGINDQPTTIDAFLISYFHMVNELIWDIALKQQGSGKIEIRSYIKALEEVMARGFSIGSISEEEIVKAKKQKPDTSTRIYGSKVNPYVPQIMGVIIKS